MKRGDIISVAVPGDYGKPRPAVIVQNDLVQHTDSVLICLMTSQLSPSDAYRVPVSANAETGLDRTSEIMADKTMTCLRAKCGPVFGRVPEATLTDLGMALGFILGLGA